MNYKRIFYYYWESVKPHKWYFFSLFLVYGLGSFLSSTVSPLIFKKIVDAFSVVDISRNELLNLFYLFAGNILVFNIFFRTGDYLIVYFEAHGLKEIAKKLFAHLSKYSYDFYINNFSGSLVAKSKRYISAFEGIVDRIVLDFFLTFIKITTILVILIYEIPKIALFLAIWFVFYIFILRFFILKKMKLDLEKSKTDSKFTGSLADNFTNILNIKIFSKGSNETERFNKDVDMNFNARYKSWIFSNHQLLFQGMMIAFLQIGSMYYLIDIYLKGLITAGVVVLVQTYLFILFDVFWSLSRSIGRFINDLSDAKEMVDILDKEIEIKDPINPEILKQGRGDIEFKNVDFEYLEGSEVFTNFNLKIKSGEKIGLVGHSGSGKSTITKMLLRFADVKGGEILVDGQNIKNITQDDLRSKISYVPQESILFHRSIGENIGYSKENANQEEIIQSAKKAHAHEFISNLQNGYDTLVGERGVKLSGGERQRIAIARAMLKDVPILILDEATSSLDSISEKYIQESLDLLMKDKTTIVIAHRLSTILKMDRILVLEKGQIIEQGTHNELLSKNGPYAKLWNHQTGFLNEE